MAPISLAILNPVSFVLMEIEKRKFLITDSSAELNDNRERLKLFLAVIKSIFTNPIIFMTLLGIVGNFAFHHTIPCYLGRVLDVSHTIFIILHIEYLKSLENIYVNVSPLFKALGSAFSASALFLLGLRMVGKVHKLKGATLVVPGILIMVKL